MKIICPSGAPPEQLEALVTHLVTQRELCVHSQWGVKGS